MGRLVKVKTEAWSQGNEMKFIDNIGTFAEKNKGVQATGKRVLLEKYLLACYKRDNWENMNKYSIINYVEGRLGRL